MWPPINRNPGKWTSVPAIAGLFLCAFTHAAVNEPRVEALIPGITVKRLPIQLKNIDSVEYGPDGWLYAAGYDGRIHVLTDTDGDGLEDKSELYWSKPGDLLTPVGILPNCHEMAHRAMVRGPNCCSKRAWPSSHQAARKRPYCRA